MLVALGFLLATLIAVLLAPAYRARAMRLTYKHMRRVMPLTESELLLDRDRLRAHYAVRIHELETKLEKLRLAAARQQVEGYARDIEPKARQAQSILEKYYRADRGVPALQAYLAAQRTLFETQLAHLGALKELHQSVIALDGLVLSGSLSTVATE